MSLPQGNPQGIWLSSKAKDGEFEPCLGVVGNLNLNCQVFFSRTYVFFSFNVEVFKVIKLTFVSWWLKRKGLLESHGHWSYLL